MSMPSAYISALNRELGNETLPLSTPDLKQRFLAWLDSVPEVSRNRRYSIVEFERALSTQGRYISPVLLSLGWTRQRDWSSKGQNQRYWVPPDC
ncbi:MAG: hypothetical protein ACRCY3_14895 [Sphingorhabdus sp.]